MRRTLRESDVVFMYRMKDPAVYRAYEATVLAWGGAHRRDRVRMLEEMGIHPTGSMWCLTAGAKVLHADPDLRDAVARDIEYEPIVVPWLPDNTCEGTPAWFGCTNHPAFRAHTRAQVCEAMKGGAAGLHVDDHLGVAHPAVSFGGCFCEHCMAKFAAYLTARQTPALLEAAGVETFAGFDYRTLVRRHARTRVEYLAVQRGIPLQREFITFHLQEAARNVSSLHELAENIAGRELSLSANAGLPHTPHMYVTPRLTYLTCEVAQHAVAGLQHSAEAVLAYRLGDALQRPMAATACGVDWAFVKARGAVNLVRYWIAQSYACGQHLMTPARAWCYTEGVGSDYYFGPTNAYAPLYRFVRRHAALFDGYRPVGAEIAVLFDPAAEFFGKGHAARLLSLLAGHNIPFDITIPANAWQTGRPLGRRLARYRQVFHIDGPGQPSELSPEDRATLDSLPGNVIAWPPAEEDAALATAEQELLRQVQVPWKIDRPDIWLFARKKPHAPPVVHLLNRHYDPQRDAFTVQHDVKVSLDRRLLGKAYRHATLYRWDADPLVLTAESTGDEISFTIPELPIWSLLVLG